MAELLCRDVPTELHCAHLIRPEQASTARSSIPLERRPAPRSSIIQHVRFTRSAARTHHYLAMESCRALPPKLLARLHERRAKLRSRHILAISTAFARPFNRPRPVDASHRSFSSGSSLNVIITADGAVARDFGIGRAALTEGRTDLRLRRRLPLASKYGPRRIGAAMSSASQLRRAPVGRRLFKGKRARHDAAIVAGESPAPSKIRVDLRRIRCLYHEGARSRPR